MAFLRLFISSFPLFFVIFSFVEAVSQLLLVTNLFLLFGFKALFVLLFLQFLNCWTASVSLMLFLD
jgi:hypothetical protein